MSHYPAKVITTAPTATQVFEILWKEIQTLFYKSAVPIGGELNQTELRLNSEWFAMGLSTNEVHRFQGFHSPNLMVILDEASGVDPIIWEAVEGLHPTKVLAIGNPINPSGDFFRIFSSPLWNKITVSCLECVEWQNRNGAIPGLVSQNWIDERRVEWGINSPLYQSRVSGEFPQEGTDTLIPMKFLDKCRANVLQEDEDAIKIVSCDVARYGEDKTVIIDRRGHKFSAFEIKEKIPTTMTSGIVKRHYEASGADCLVVDDSGLGGGVTDRLVEQRIGVLPFNGGSKEKAIDKNHFKNLRSQFYWYTAKKFEAGLYDLSAMPQQQFEILKNQLCAIRYEIQSDGKIAIESKDDMKARGLCSPDLADAICMSEYAFYMGKFSEVKAFSYR